MLHPHQVIGFALTTLLAAMVGWAPIAAGQESTQLLGTMIPSAPAQDAGIQVGRSLSEDQLDSLFDLPDAAGLEAMIAARSRIYQPRGAKEIGVNKKIAPSTVFIQQGKSTCTGTLVGNDGEILTCWHCVRGKGEILVRLHPASGESRLQIARVIRTDPNADLALLQLPERPQALKPLALAAEKEVLVGADVYAVGHPSGLNWSFVKGIVSQVYEKRVWDFESNRHEAEVIQSQIPLYEGNSGGPLVSEKGLLVGVNASKRNDGQFTFAIAVSEVRRFLGKSANAPAATEAIAAAPASCKRRKLAEGRNADNTGTLTLYDTDCDSKADTALTVPDDASRPVVLARSGDGSGRADAVRVRQGTEQSTYLSGKKAVIRLEANQVTTAPLSVKSASP